MYIRLLITICNHKILLKSSTLQEKWHAFTWLLPALLPNYQKELWRQIYTDYIQQMRQSKWNWRVTKLVYYKAILSIYSWICDESQFQTLSQGRARKKNEISSQPSYEPGMDTPWCRCFKTRPQLTVKHEKLKHLGMMVFIFCDCFVHNCPQDC